MLVMASQLYNYTPAELQKLLDESDGYADLLRKLNMSTHGANHTTLRKIIDEYNLDLTQVSINRKNKQLKGLIPNKAKSLDEILVKDSTYQSFRLLQKLIDAGYKERKCERCGITEWMNKEISFHLHHKDGNHSNNELENLETLCPNCHSQTDNFAGKNIKKIPKLTRQQEKKKAQYGISEDGQRFYDGYGSYKILCPVCQKNFMNKAATQCRFCYEKKIRTPKVSKEELLKIMETNTYGSAAELLGVDRDTVSRWHKYYTNKERENGIMIVGSDKAPDRETLKNDIREMPTMVSVGRKYDVTDNTVRKWCDNYDLPRHVSEIRSYSDEEWKKI